MDFQILGSRYTQGLELLLKGSVYGTDEQLRRTAEWIRKNPCLSFGSVREEGYGEACLTVDALKEDALPKETLSSCFDVSCLSHTLLFNEDGMSATSPEEFLAELEYHCSLPGRFEIVGRYTDIYTDYKNRFAWNGQGPVTRCLKMGSVLRIRTKDGMGADISPILHTFIGENTLDGYGEIMTWPSTGSYYRIAREINPGKYDLAFEILSRDMHLGASLIHRVLAELLKERAAALGELDAYEAAAGGNEIRVPTDVLTLFRDRYAPELAVEMLEQWYREGLDRNLARISLQED